MANITKRTNKDGTVSYRIRAFVSENKKGKQKMPSVTWTPAPGMTARQIEKELQRQATLFEEKARSGLTGIDGSIKFEDYAARWIAGAQLSPKCEARYRELLERINEAIGHVQLSKLQPQHLQEFYKNLSENGIRKDSGYAVFKDLHAVLKARNMTRAKMAASAGVAPITITAACKGEHVTPQTAQAICKALDMKPDALYEFHPGEGKLSDKTILHHHRLISSILGQATREQIIPRNVASRDFVKAPRVQKKEPVYLDDIQARRVIELLAAEEDIRTRVSITLLLYSGVRRGELCGLSWEDVDYRQGVIHILRASQ